MKIVLQTMITNLLAQDRTVNWVGTRGLHIAAGKSAIVDGAYPTLCRNRQATKCMESDLEQGWVAVTLVTNLQVAQPAGGAGSHPIPEAVKPVDPPVAPEAPEADTDNTDTVVGYVAPTGKELKPAGDSNVGSQQTIDAKDEQFRTGGIDALKPPAVTLPGHDPVVEQPPTSAVFEDGPSLDKADDAPENPMAAAVAEAAAAEIPGAEDADTSEDTSGDTSGDTDSGQTEGEVDTTPEADATSDADSGDTSEDTSGDTAPDAPAPKAPAKKTTGRRRKSTKKAGKGQSTKAE